MKIKCPRCKQITEYSRDNPFRPFCSERCKLIDLGHWADGSYAIPAQEGADPEGLDDESGEEPGTTGDSSTSFDPEGALH